MIFLKLIAHSWRSLWQSSGKVWRGYGKTVARLWQSYGKGIAKLWLSYVWPYIVRMRRTDARLRRTDAHNIKLYIYIYDDDGDGWIGWILDGEYACLSFFLDGFGVGPWFLDDPEWILRDFGCMLGWFLDGF